MEFDLLGSVGADELFCDGLRAVGGGVVDDEEFVIEVAGVGC